MPLARFSAFHELPPNTSNGLPGPAFAVMIARAGDGALLVFNRYRKVWELPGGFIDVGESAQQCAERELLEEAGCVARQSTCLGIVEVDDGRRHFGAVFQCTVGEVPESFANEEIAAIGRWRSNQAPQPLGHPDAELLRRFG